jgi:hypothetical protein
MWQTPTEYKNAIAYYTVHNTFLALRATLYNKTTVTCTERSSEASIHIQDERFSGRLNGLLPAEGPLSTSPPPYVFMV